jgi:hypothetical protein
VPGVWRNLHAGRCAQARKTLSLPLLKTGHIAVPIEQQTNRPMQETADGFTKKFGKKRQEVWKRK